MCTAVAFYREGLYFGRNMDIDRPFGQKVVIAPRGYAFPYRCRAAQPLSYALIGMASVTDGVPLYAEAANECGLCMAGLYFPQSASYFPPGHAADGRVTLAPYELIPYLLGGCRDCAEALRLLSRVDLAAVPFREDLPVAPLHFFLADATGAFAAEWTKEGLAVYEDGFRVLTNEPGFPFHRENVRQYLALSPSAPQGGTFAAGLRPFGEGAGAIGLPGDASPASRFVRAAFALANSACAPDPRSCVGQTFHVLGSVAMPRGSVRTGEGRDEITLYACCFSVPECAYYYRTYGNGRLTKVALTEARRSGKALLVFPLREEEDVFEEENASGA